MTPAAKLGALRILMAESDVDCYLVLSEDNHQSEYVSPCDERRSYLSGFSGSAGTAVVTRGEALVYTDSRYYLQASAQLRGFELRRQEPELPTLEEDLFGALELGGKRIGVDPAVFPAARAEQWGGEWAKKAALLSRGGPPVAPPVIVPVAGNLVDRIWPNRPAIPAMPIKAHPLELAGEDVPSKLSRVRAAVADLKAGALVVTALDQICWLLNLRGSDIECNPVFFSYVILTPAGCDLFVDRTSLPGSEPALPPPVAAHLSAAGVSVHPYADFTASSLPSHLPPASFVLVEKGACSLAIAGGIEGGGCTLVETEHASPVNVMKAVKNEAEKEGIRKSSVRDSAAVVRFFAWLEEELGKEGVAGSDAMAEAALADRLEEFRAQQGGFVGVSFDTISSVGPNSAVVHYKPEAGSDAELRLGADDIYLLDSGGQYLDGTTDVTRTVCFGSPTADQRRYYSLVLAGHVNLGRARFPEGTCGLVLDGLARAPLWGAGLDYGHGTGHGIGAYLNVHEGPFGISGASRPGNLVRKNPRAQQVLLEPIVEGNYMSNEPGFYLDGEYGFRIESDVITVKAEATKEGGRKYLEFDCVTKVPMCRKLTDVAVLSKAELDWLNAYHEDCLASVGPLLKEQGDERALRWLERECAKLD
ncbi:hypothetical protein TeGR_g4510 [Tetraparma gracilis]|nr:hypothetical protein TeGR_g4510 [Tetraparma gracilis]